MQDFLQGPEGRMLLSHAPQMINRTNLRMLSIRTTPSHNPWASTNHATLRRTVSSPAISPPRRTCPLLSPSTIQALSGFTVLNSATVVLGLLWLVSSTRQSNLPFPSVALFRITDTECHDPQTAERNHRHLHQQCQSRYSGREARGHYGWSFHRRDEFILQLDLFRRVYHHVWVAQQQWNWHSDGFCCYCFQNKRCMGCGCHCRWWGRRIGCAFCCNAVVGRGGLADSSGGLSRDVLQTIIYVPSDV